MADLPIRPEDLEKITTAAAQKAVDTLSPQLDQLLLSQQQQLTMVAASRTTTGPIPSPELFKQYPEAVQKTILEMAVKEQDFQHEGARSQLELAHKREDNVKHDRTMRTVTTILFLVLFTGLSGFLGSKGQTVPASITGGAGPVGVVQAIINGQLLKRSHDKEKGEGISAEEIGNPNS